MKLRSQTLKNCLKVRIPVVMSKLILILMVTFLMVIELLIWTC